MLRTRLLLVVSVLLAGILPLLPSVALAIAPANDDLANATTISVLPYDDSMNTHDATVQGGEPAPTCSGAAGYTVWYRFTPSTSGIYEISSLTQVPVISLFQATGLTFEALTAVDCALSSDTLTATMRPYLTAGDLYVIRSGATGGGGSAGHELHMSGPIAAPANDDLTSATAIPSDRFENVVNTTGATTQVNEPDPTCAPGALHNTIWYTLVADKTSTHRFDTTNSLGMGSSAASVVEVFAAPSLDFGSLSSIGCAASSSPTNNPSVDVSLTSGTTYAVRLSSLSPYGMSQSRLYVLGPPAHDHLANAHVVGSVPFTSTYDAMYATVEGGEPNATCRGPIAPVRSAWFSFTPDTTGRYQIDARGSAGGTTSIDVFTAPTLTYGALTSIACVTFPNSALSPHLTAGVSYAIRIDKNFGVQLDISGPISAPSNDNLTNATSITSASLPFTQTVNTVAATIEGGEPGFTCSGPYTNNSVWYSFTPATSGLYRFDTAGSSGSASGGGQTGLDVFTAPTLAYGSLTSLACDYFDTGTATLVNVELTAGVQYAIRMTASSGFGLTNAKLNVEILPDAAENDDLADATTIGSLPFSESLDTRGATLESGEPPTSCYSPRHSSIWYFLTPANTGYYKLDAAGSGDGSILDILDAPSMDFATFANVGCFRSDSHDPIRSQLFELTGGTRYAIRASSIDVGGLVNSTLTVSGPFSGPANDHLAWAKRVTALPFTHTVDATNASPEASEPASTCFVPQGRSIWYVFTPASTAVYRIDTNYQILTAFVAPTLTYAELTEVGCDASGPKSLTLMLQAGTQYAIRSSSFSAFSGAPAVETNVTLISSRPSISVFTPTLKGDTGLGGRVLAFADIGVATDPEGESLTIACNPAVGTVLPFGTTNVTCTATDPFGLTRSDSGMVTIIDDSVPPTTTATSDPTANAAGWHMGNATVTLSAVDNAGGAGFKKLTYRATGAQTIASTSVNSPTTSFDITAEGITTVRAFATDLVGNVEPTTMFVVRIDKQRPTSTAPVATINPSMNANGTVPFTLNWLASDPGGSGLERTFLQQRLNGSPTNTSVPLATLKATNKVIALTSGNRYQFRTRASDRAGNFSQMSSTLPWAAGPSFLVAVVQDNATTGVVPAYSGSWNTVTSSTYFGGTTRVTTTIDQTVSVTFTGTEVAWISSIGPGQGTALVTLDGVETVVDLYELSATTKHRRIAFQRDGLTNTTHTLTIRVLEKSPASSSRRVVFDGLVVTAP